MTRATDKPDVELFGPILQIYRTDSFEAAIAEANDTRYGLSASLVSQAPERAGTAEPPASPRTDASIPTLTPPTLATTRPWLQASASCGGFRHPTV